MSWDPYAALGLTRQASADDIRNAHRKLAKELHPDIRPNDKQATERFKRATAAYNLLSDPEKRARYDRGELDSQGNEQASQGPRGGFGGWNQSGPSASDGFSHSQYGAWGQGAQNGRPDFGGRDPFRQRGRQAGPDMADDGLADMFQELFGAQMRGGSKRGDAGAASQGRRPKTEDLPRIAVDVEFLEAARGIRKRILLPDHRSVDLQVPAGVESGQLLRLRGQKAKPDARAKAGSNPTDPADFLIEIRVKDDPRFRRQGDDVYMDLGISLREAVEGGKVGFESPGGMVSLTIPKGSNSGRLLRLRGKGVQKSPPGDLLVRLIISLPDYGPEMSQDGDAELAEFVKKWSQRDLDPERHPG